ncbi:hypothetical protein [Caulobacter sp. NIBR1757]|uniref:hypothetical protein n=1 Tax=Caulobacter sp. NIBR1757 TaxID=3016000 RepID=UPI0022F07464|nr:hypothetical protein [Caulobacter sp. NIBR1757]WGM38731.1 hypothetical protein AMEJIAPC_01636 [Caulobacter sp. NIBR1757]
MRGPLVPWIPLIVAVLLVPLWLLTALFFTLLSRAVHRATDDVIVSGLWTGVALTLTTGGLQLVFKHSPIAPSFRRVQDAIAQYRLRLKEEGKARKEAARRGEAAFDINGATLQTYVTPDSAADAKRHVSVLLRRDLFADPQTPSPTPVEPAPEPEKPPVA